MDIKEIMNENIPALIQQNQNLQSELDKAIKDNRMLVKALKDIAERYNEEVHKLLDENDSPEWFFACQDMEITAQKTLVEIGEEE